jgi:hypothetical protein
MQRGSFFSIECGLMGKWTLTPTLFKESILDVKSATLDNNKQNIVTMKKENAAHLEHKNTNPELINLLWLN